MLPSPSLPLPPPPPNGTAGSVRCPLPTWELARLAQRDKGHVEGQGQGGAEDEPTGLEGCRWGAGGGRGHSIPGKRKHVSMSTDAKCVCFQTCCRLWRTSASAGSSPHLRQQHPLTCDDINLHVPVALSEEVHGVLEGLGVEQDGGHILEHDALLQAWRGQWCIGA